MTLYESVAMEQQIERLLSLDLHTRDCVSNNCEFYAMHALSLASLSLRHLQNSYKSLAFETRSTYMCTCSAWYIDSPVNERTSGSTGCLDDAAPNTPCSPPSPLLSDKGLDFELSRNIYIINMKRTLTARVEQDN